MALSIVTNPTRGTVVINNNGTPINSADDFITYTPNANANGTDNFTYQVSDGRGGIATATVNLTINAVNDAPVATAPSSLTVQSNGTTISGISISDVDAGSGLLTTILSVTNGSLNLTNLSGATVVGGALNTTTVTLRGTLAQLNAALTTLRYSGGSFSGDTNLTVNVNDNGNIGAGGALTSNKTVALKVASNVGSLGNAPVNVTGSVNSSDTLDRYQFTLSTATNNFRLTLRNLTANADVYILDSSGVVRAFSTNSGTTDESISGLSLPAGTYFIEVRRVSGSTGYNLRFQR